MKQWRVRSFIAENCAKPKLVAYCIVFLNPNSHPVMQAHWSDIIMIPKRLDILAITNSFHVSGNCKKKKQQQNREKILERKILDWNNLPRLSADLK